MVGKTKIKDKYQAKTFCFLLVFSFGQFDIEQIISKHRISLSLSNVGNKYNLGIPEVAKTQLMTNMKREPRGRLRDPFLCRKIILETIKSFTISAYYNFVFLYIEIDTSCLVK